MIDLGSENFEFDHVGVAVNSIAEGLKFYQALGIKSAHEETVPSEMVRVAMLNLNNDCRIELLESTSPEGPISKFISKRGPGIHHICLRVEGIESLAKRLVSKGIQLINETPRQGAHNCKVVFVHPKSNGGVLLELSERTEA